MDKINRSDYALVTIETIYVTEMGCLVMRAHSGLQHFYCLLRFLVKHIFQNKFKKKRGYVS